MLPKTKLLERLVDNGIVAVIRKVPNDKVDYLAEILIKSGIKALEITVDSPNALTIIQKLSREFSNRAVIGAGTVLDSSSAEMAISNGAEFIVSPYLDARVIKTTLKYGKVSIPGVMTPTEAMKAVELGADIVKVFPADSVGASFIKNIRGPLPQLPIIPTGGITLNNAADYINAGSVAIGVGGDLIDNDLLVEGDFQEIERKAKQYYEVVSEARKK